MSNEGYLFSLYTDTISGSRWAARRMGEISDFEENQIKNHGRFVSEEFSKEQFRDLLAKTVKNEPSMNEEDVDWELLYTMYRNWFKRAMETTENKEERQITNSAKTSGNIKDNPFNVLVNTDEEINRRKYFDTGLKIAEKYNPIVNRVIKYYADILLVSCITSQGEIEYSTFHPETDLYKNKRIYSWILFGVPTGEHYYPRPLLEIELSYVYTGEYYFAVRFYKVAGPGAYIIGDEEINLNLPDEEFEQKLIEAIKILHRKLVDLSENRQTSGEGEER